MLCLEPTLPALPYMPCRISEERGKEGLPWEEARKELRKGQEESGSDSFSGVFFSDDVEEQEILIPNSEFSVGEDIAFRTAVPMVIPLAFFLRRQDWGCNLPSEVKASCPACLLTIQALEAGKESDTLPDHSR